MMLMNKGSKLVAEYGMKHDRRENMMHSSGFATAQSGVNLGAAAGETFAERQALDEKRKFVRRYSNSRIMNEFYGPERARKYDLKKDKGSDFRVKTAEKQRKAAENPMDKVVKEAKKPIVSERRSGLRFRD